MAGRPQSAPSRENSRDIVVVTVPVVYVNPGRSAETTGVRRLAPAQPVASVNAIGAMDLEAVCMTTP